MSADTVTRAADTGFSTARTMARWLRSLTVLEYKAAIQADRWFNNQATPFGLEAAFDMGKMSINLFFRLVDRLRQFTCSLRPFGEQADDLAADRVAFDIQWRHDRSTWGIGSDGDWVWLRRNRSTLALPIPVIVCISENGTSVKP